MNNAVGKNGEPLRNFTCKICLKTVYDPRICASGCQNGIFCTLCLAHEQKKNGDTSCPNCKQKCNFKELGNLLISIMNEQKVKCTKTNCSAEGTFFKYNDFVNQHVKACSNNKVECPICKVEQVPELDMFIHFTKCSQVIE